jgi:hypothetical protein
MRSERKKRTDIEFLNCGGLTDLFDNLVKEIYYINDDEYDYICEKATNEEIEIFVNENATFGEKRQVLKFIDKYIEEFYKIEL